jgi:hypothetical protein
MIVATVRLGILTIPVHLASTPFFGVTVAPALHS